MSKRSQTTALPKETPKPAPVEGGESGGKQTSPKLRQEYRSRAEREHEIQRWVIIGTVAAIVVVVLLLGYTIVSEQIITPNQVVASVDGQNITVTQFQKRVRLERYLRNQQLTQQMQLYTTFYGATQDQAAQQLQQQEPYATWIKELQVPDQLGLTMVNTMIQEQLIRNAAKEKGITVSQADIDAQINKFFGYTPPVVAGAEATAEATATVTPTPTITPTPYVSPTPSPVPTATATLAVTATVTTTPAATLPPTATLTNDAQIKQFQDNRDTVFRDLRTQTSMSDADINSYFELQALRVKLQDAVATNVGTTGTFVDARHILVATEEEANDVINALNAGESFAELAKSVSTDTGSGANGGELGWQPVTTYVKEFQDAVKAAKIGDIVGPIKSQFGYHVIQVRAREDRPLSQDQIDTAKSNAFSNWLKDYQDSKKDKTTTNSIWANYVPTTPQTIFG